MTSNRRPAWERGAGAEEPRRVSGGSRASGPGGGRVAAAGPLCPSRWARASDRSARRFPPSGLREGTPSRLRPPARLERANRAAVRARRGPQCLFRVCCRGFPGTRLALPRPLPQGFVLTGNVLPGDVCVMGVGVFFWGGGQPVQTPVRPSRLPSLGDRGGSAVQARGPTPGPSRMACASQSCPSRGHLRG